MKIICEKGYHAGNVLRLVAEYLEKRYPDDMILDENMEITLSLKNGENGQPIVLGEEELQLSYHELVCSATLRSTQILNISAHRKWGKSGAVVTN